MPKRLTLEDFISKATTLHSQKYIYDRTVYINNKTKIEIYCPKHGPFWQTPDKHLSNRGCPTCGIETNRTDATIYNTTEELVAKFIGVHGMDAYNYDLVVGVGTRHKVEIRCLSCSATFHQRADNHLQGTGCPVCRSSKGESAIRSFLAENYIPFIEQWNFHRECRNPITDRPLAFDFYLPSRHICIEFDGKQHIHPTAFGHDQSNETKEKNFEGQQFRDAIKNRYCEDRDIQLIRIGHLDIKEIPEILTSI